MARDKVCVVIGAGDATGGAIARRFAREGFTAVVTRRRAERQASGAPSAATMRADARGTPPYIPTWSAV